LVTAVHVSLFELRTYSNSFLFNPQKFVLPF